MRRLPSLAGLRAFEAAARHSSFKRAAEELHVTPTAISHQVRQLEAAIGAPLVRAPDPPGGADAGGPRAAAGAERGVRQLRARDRRPDAPQPPCCEYHLETPRGDRLVVMANHFKSKGYSTPGDPQGAKRRARQAARVRQIYEERLTEGFKYIAITGDLNDTPDSPSLEQLLDAPGLSDISAHPAFEWNGRRGTYGSGNEQDRLHPPVRSTVR